MYGSAFWRFLHYFALNDSGSGRDLIRQLPPFLPSDSWRMEWEDPGEGVDLVVWSKELHNKVNKKLSRYDRWDMNDFGITQTNICDECCVPVFEFPWGFIHKVAEIGGDAALAFLKRFNEIFPCSHCRGKFFTDDPNEGETVLQWTVRNRNRIRSEKGLPAVTYLSQSQQKEDNGQCVLPLV